MYTDVALGGPKPTKKKGPHVYMTQVVATMQNTQKKKKAQCQAHENTRKTKNKRNKNKRNKNEQTNKQASEQIYKQTKTNYRTGEAPAYTE